MAEFTIGSRPTSGQPEPVKIPKENQSVSSPGQVDIAPPLITAKQKVDESRKVGLLPPFIPTQPGEDDFVAPAFVRVGTDEGIQAFANITDGSNPEGRRIANKAQWALRDKEVYDKKHTEWSTQRSGLVAGTPPRMGILPIGAGGKEPELHPLTSWLTSFGKTDAEIVLGIAKAQIRAEYYASRYMKNGVEKLIDSDDSLLSAPEALFSHMKGAGLFKTKDEEEFFKAGVSNKYSGQYETSPFQILQRAYKAKFKGTMHPSQLKTNIDSYGFRLNPKNAEHKKMFREFLAWEDAHPEQDSLYTRFGRNLNTTAGHLADAVGNAVYTSVSSVGYPEISWSDEFTDEPAKQALEQKLLQLASARENGESLNGFTENSALDIVIKKYGKEGIVDMDMLDDDKRAAVPQLIIDISKEVKFLDERGAFKKDVRGLTSLLTGLSAAVTGGIGMAMMGVNSDPRSTTMRINNSVKALTDYVLDDDTGRRRVTIEELYEEAQMEGMNTGAAYANWHHHLAKDGIFGNGVVDSRWHESASMFITPFEAYALFGGITKAGFRAAGVGKAAQGRNFLQRIGLQDSLDATLNQVNTLARQGVALTPDVLPPDVRYMVNGIQNEAVLAGEKIDIYEAIKRAFEGKGKMIDPKNPARMVKASEGMLNSLANAIEQKASQVQSVRDAIATAANEGKKVIYSKESMDMIAKARQRLQEIHPETDFSKLPDSIIYDRLMRGKVPVLANGKPVITPNEMNSLTREVGRAWRRIDAKDIAGYVGGSQLPVQFNFIYDNPLAKGVNELLKGVGTGSEWLDALEKTYGSPRSGITAGFKVAGSAGVTATALQSTSPGIFRWAMLNSVIPLARTIGGIGRQLEIIQEYAKLASVKGNDFDSAMLGVRGNIQAERRQLLIKRASLTRGEWPYISKQLKELGETVVREEPDLVSQSVNVEKEIKKIDLRLDYLEAKSDHVKRLHSIGANGVLAASARLYKDGMVSVASNELLLGLTDNFAGVGSGTAFAGFGSATNAITSGWTSHFSRDVNLRERTNHDMGQIRGYMDALGHDAIGNVQRMKIIKVMMQARDDADLIAKKSGANAGETHFAKQMFTLAQVFRTNAKLELTSGGVRNGLVGLMESVQHQDPEFADAVKKQYLDTATKMGLKGEEAEGYAQRMIEGIMLSNAGRVRLGTIAKETDILTTKIKTIQDGTLTELANLEAGAKVIAAEAGLNIEDMFPNGFSTPPIKETATIENEYGVPQPTTPIGEMAPQLRNIDTSKMSPDVVKKIATFQQEFVRIKNMQLESHNEIRDINSQLSKLEVEKVGIASRNPITEFRDGQVNISVLDDAVFTSMKNGITVWDRNGETTIYLDESKFSTSTGREEVAHALFFHKNMADSRAALKNMILGEWGVDANGKAVMTHAPKIAKTVEGSLQLMDMFVKAHAETLSESEAVMFRATWEMGKKNQARNPNDTRLMQQVFLELAGKLYQARLESANPHFGRTDAMGSSPQGSFEGGTVTERVKQGFESGAPEGRFAAGWSRVKFWNKLVFGSLTIEDMVNDGNSINTADIDWNGKSPNAKPNLKERIVDASMFLATFGRNGMMEQFWKEMTQDKLTDMGFVLSGNQSKDPNQFYKYGTFRHPITNEIIPIGKHEWEWSSQMLAHTRNRGTKTDTDALWDLDTIVKEQKDDSEASKKRRWQWALASNRENFINPNTLMFKKSLDKLMQAEWAPIGSIVQRVIAPLPGDGAEWSGLKVKKTLDGKTVLVGAPNAQQTKRIIQHIQENYGKDSGANEIVMKNIVTLLNAIADGNWKDPKATPTAKGGAPGWTQVFLAEYAPVTYRTEIGSTKKEYQYGEDPRLRILVPLRVEIRDSSLDVKGKKKTEAEEGEEPRLPEMYIHMWSPARANQSKLNAWNGNFFDVDGSQPISAKLIQGLFKTRANLNEACDLVLSNYQAGGSVDRVKGGELSEAPPDHSWEVLLKMAQGNPFNAKKMANIVNRIMGFEQTQYVELNGLEQEFIAKKGKLSAQKQAALDELREKFDPENEDEGARSVESVSAREERLAILYGQNPNTIGRNPMRDAQHPISMYRIDRFGEIIPHQGEDGKNKFVKWNQFTEGWGNANYSSTNWVPLGAPELEAKRKGYNMAGLQLVEGLTHRSGYSMFTLENPKNFDINDIPTRELFMIDPNGKLVGRGYRDKQSAIIDAETHARNSKLPPENNNAVEQALGAAGFRPVGVNFAGNIRDTFVHESGRYRIERSPKRGYMGFDLIDINTGLILAEQLKAGIGRDKKTPNITDITEAITWVEDNNIVQVKLTEAYEKSLGKESGGNLATWTKVIDDTGATSQQLLAAKNPVYYDIRRRLALDLGWKTVNEITNIMRQELGDDVVGTSHKAVVEWFDKWQEGWSAEEVKKMAQRGYESAKQDVDAINKSEQELYNLRAGEMIGWELPKPKQPTAAKPTGISEKDKTAAEKFKKQMDDYTRDSIAWDQNQAELKTDFAVDDTKIANIMKYIKELKKREAEFAKIAQATGMSSAAFDAQRGQAVADKMAFVNNSMREAGVAGESIWYINNGGYIMQQLMYKDIGKRVGIQITGKKVLVQGADRADVKDANFILYSPGGQILMRAKTMEELADEVHKRTEGRWLKQFVLQGKATEPNPEALRGTPKGPVTPSRATMVGPDSRYTKPAPR
jgi:hypothetical protein